MKVLKAGMFLLILACLVTVITLIHQDHEAIKVQSKEAVQELSASWDPLVSRVDTLESRTNRLESKVDAWVERQ